LFLDLAFHKPNATRSNLAIERQLNEMNDTLEGYKHTSEQHQMTTDIKLSRILEAIKRLESAPVVASGIQNPVPSPSSPSTAIKACLTNPTPTPELIATVSKVVSESRTRVGNKKSGAEYNSCKVGGIVKIGCT
jgi:hypothetical protein